MKKHILAERKVPRYTSYPTAPHFTPAIGSQTYAAWLTALPRTATLSLYLHVPFCSELCHYCGCHTKAVRRRDPIDRYVSRLMAEIDLIATHISGGRVTNVHWGGGTPSILGERSLADIKSKLDQTFDLSTLGEHAIELDPRHVSPSIAHACAAMGINRVSLGVQDFAPHVQCSIGRIQPFEQVEDAITQLRALGVDCINLDLMYGLPRQSIADVENSAERAAALQPQRLALFGYAHVPWFKSQQRLIDEKTLPSAEQRIAQVQAASAVLLARGYVAVGLDHFALPDDDLTLAQSNRRLHRNFQGYTTDASDALIGFGASAISRCPLGFVQNHVDVASYGRAIEAGKLASAKGIALTPDDSVRGIIIERLMCDMAVNLRAFAGHHGNASGRAFAAEIEALEELASEGLIQINDHIITVTEGGRPFVRLVAAVFDAYLPQNQGWHSIAV
jgi:oxygen-independent coproporphyrinogen-3 oxidase